MRVQAAGLCGDFCFIHKFTRNEDELVEWFSLAQKLSNYGTTRSREVETMTN
uniref:Uncharacterized protein n=1 Tax=Arion vulgaris TaxID=1028688 RepID=A0A0B6Z7M4_9EUPU